MPRSARGSREGFVEARLTLISTADGGRSSGVRTNYRPHWRVRPDLETTASLSLEDCKWLEPGATALVRLHPIWPEAWTDIQAGSEVLGCEGSRVIGRAVVVRSALKRQPSTP